MPQADLPPGWPDPPRLTGAQRRHVGLMLNRLAVETRRWIRDIDDLAPGSHRAEEFRALLEDLLLRTETAARRLSIDLGERGPDPRRRLLAWSAAWWSTVLDSRARALAAWGEVDPAAAAVVDPLVHGLADALERVRTLAADAVGGTRERRSPGNAPPHDPG